MIFNLRAKEVLGVIESDSTKLSGSYASALKINKIGGVCEQGENPSPTNKQEINNSVVSELKIHGKNKFDSSILSNAQNGILTYVHIKGEPNTAYTFSSNIPKTYSWDSTAYVFMYTTYGSVSTNVNGVWDGQARTAITGEDGIITIAYRMDTNNISDLTQYWYQLEENTFATEYEPYTELIITLSQAIELYGIRDLQDVIDVENRVVRKKIKKVVFDGSDDETWIRGASDTPNYMRFTIIPTDSVKGNKNNKIANILCTHHAATSADNTYLRTNGVCIEGNGAITFYNEQFAFYTLDEWKAELAQNPITVLYEIAEEITEELPLTDQLALNRIKTFNVVTYVEFDGKVKATLNSYYATNLVGAVVLKAYADNEIAKYFMTYSNDNYKATMQQGHVGFGHKDEDVFAKITASTAIINELPYDALSIATKEGLIYFVANGCKRYVINPDNLPLTDDKYTETHYFDGTVRITGSVNINEWVTAKNLQADQMVFAQAVQTSNDVISKANVTAENNIVATNELRGKDLHFTNMGVNGGVAQPVEWVWDAALERYVLCTVTGQVVT